MNDLARLDTKIAISNLEARIPHRLAESVAYFLVGIFCVTLVETSTKQARLNHGMNSFICWGFAVCCTYLAIMCTSFSYTSGCEALSLTHKRRDLLNQLRREK